MNIETKEDLILSIFLKCKPIVFLKDKNIMGYKPNTKVCIVGYNGNRFSITIDGLWYGWYSIDNFKTKFSLNIFRTIASFISIQLIKYLKRD